MIRRLLCTTAIVLATAMAAPVAMADDTVGTTVGDGTAADVDARRTEMSDAMTVWETRVDTYRDEGGTVDDAFTRTWAGVEAAWADVETATAETWDDAVAGFDAAMVELERSWEEMTGDDAGT